MLPRIGIIVGPRTKGSNMAAIIRACREGGLQAMVQVVVAPTAEAPAAELARAMDVPVSIVSPGVNYGEELLVALSGVDLVCLAGFLRLLPAEVLSRFTGRILNIHPALLPKFGGKGMYGMHVHRAVLAAGETESGCTVHRVTDHYDEGPIVLQKACPVKPDDTPDTLAARVLELEHEAYPEAIAKVLASLR